MVSVETFTTITWSCVHFEQPFDISTVISELGARGVAAFEISAADIGTKEALLAAVAKGMEFPDYFGKNWDALDECLRDMSWRPAKGYTLFVHQARELWGRTGVVAGKFLEVWLFAAEEWSHENVPFHLVFMW